MGARSPVLVSPSSTTGAVLRFAVIAVVATMVIGVLMAMAFGGAAERRAILVSACIALPVQLATFAAVRSMPREQVMTAWFGGMLVRFLALVVYGFLMMKVFRLPLDAALVSFATMLFVLTLIEPLLLNKS
ncbi:MAG: hypothetical protein ACJ79K_03105 [Gemmatimonadaceae bacterium]